MPDVAVGGGATSTTLPDEIAGIDVATIRRVVDERPIGAAALSGGTHGGGLFDDALNAGTWVEVRTAPELIDAVSDDLPRIVLLHPGLYDLGEPEPYSLEACQVACPDASTNSAILRPTGDCDNEAELLTVTSRMRRLRVGSNKTIVALGGGATLNNVQLELSGSQNIILRNLELRDVNPGFSGTGNAIVMWPTRHVWVDHCSFSHSSHTFINIHSTWDQETSSIPLVDVASHITLSFNAFDGSGAATCSGQLNWGVGTQRNPALTLHHNLMRAINQGAPYLFGPETWGHVFNNVIREALTYGVGVTCGARGLIEANVFEGNRFALHVGDDGSPTWPFCADGLFGHAWFPTAETTGSSRNSLEAAASVRISGQALDGSTLDLPRPSGNGWLVNVPLAAGNESYEYSLEAANPTFAESLAERVGVGQLF